MNKKLLITLITVLVVACCAVGTTVAWITAVSDPVVNVFVFSNGIDLGDGIEEPLAEVAYPDGEFPMVPGADLTKDPTITVKEDSIAMYLFVKVEESDNLSDFVTYSINTTDWAQLTDDAGADVDGVYFMALSAKTESDTPYTILTDNKVTVNEDVTQEELEALDESTYPTLTFTAYAIQYEGMDDEYDAWTNIQSELAD